MTDLLDDIQISRRERDVLCAYCLDPQGSYKRVGAQLGITQQTVKNHMYALRTKAHGTHISYLCYLMGLSRKGYRIDAFRAKDV